MSHPAPDPHHAKFAWRDIPARTLPKRSASERAADFLEIYGLYDPETAKEQASRCIQCPNPTCVQGCPLCNPIPQWMLLTAEGKLLEAAALLGSSTNMPEICSRLCPSDHLCEGNCVLDSVSGPVPIRALEQFLMDYAFEKGAVDAAAAPANGFSVGVVGSGPGGLTAADELSRQGFAVTVYDLETYPGGLLVNGTPVFDLDSSIVKRRIQLLKDRGVKFELGIPLFKETTVSELAAKHDAIYIGLDSRKARVLEMPGSQLPGVIHALPFLLQKNTPFPLDTPPVVVHGKKVAIIGGGDTAIECARSAIRYGASRVTVYYRRTEGTMPCAREPYAAAVEEGVRFDFNVSPVMASPDEAGHLRAVQFVRTNPDGTPQAGTEFEEPIDFLIPAIGFEPAPLPPTPDLPHLARQPNGLLVVDESHKTPVAKIYAGGDTVRGPTPLLETVRDARLAAQGIAKALAG